jgi:hypothetical protein
MIKQLLLLLQVISFNVHSYSQDSFYLKVHFLYGSKPGKEYRETEPKWFGGMLGGHVGIEGDSGKVLSFLPSGKFHWFAKKKDKHSTYAIHSTGEFYSILCGNPDSIKKAVVVIPITAAQKKIFDSISAAYLAKTPYDYALWGMRCGAAGYEILAQTGILPKYSYSRTFRKIFYPRRLRKRLFKKAAEYNWIIQRQEGSQRRKWERD